MNESNKNNTIIIIDGVGDVFPLLERKLNSKGQKVTKCTDISEACAKAAESATDMIFVRLETINTDAKDIIMALHSNEHTGNATIYAVVTDKDALSQSSFLMLYGYDGWIIGMKEIDGKLSTSKVEVITRRPKAEVLPDNAEPRRTRDLSGWGIWGWGPPGMRQR